MSRYIRIEDWAKGPNGFGYPKTKRQLVRIAKLKQTIPPATKDGRIWVIDENAKFIGSVGVVRVSDNLPDKAKLLVERSLNVTTT